jgi:PTH1 family peptidyl-tRNA hydrolase
MSWFRKKPSHSPWLVVGLGNPGARYAANRHNVGFLAVERWAARHGIELSRKRPWALLGEGTAVIDSQSIRVLVAKPRTFMNLSGDAVGEVVHRYHVDIRQVIVIYDEADLPLGKLRIRESGSAGGQKGIASVIDVLGTQDVLRLRIGIGRPKGPNADTIDHVLGDFTSQEATVVDEVLELAMGAVDCMLAEGPASAMSRFNAG